MELSEFQRFPIIPKIPIARISATNIMKNSELIKKLQSLPDDLEVTIFDWKQNVHKGEDGTIGVHVKFEVELLDNDAEEKKQDKFIALTFENDDYNDDGTLAEK